MRTILIYAMIFTGVYFIVNLWSQRKQLMPESRPRPGRRFRSKEPKGIWVQVYDTDSIDHAQGILARLEEDEIECIVYEQGRKDVHGNELKGYGITVPRSAVSRAQTIISRMPV